MINRFFGELKGNFCELDFLTTYKYCPVSSKKFFWDIPDCIFQDGYVKYKGANLEHFSHGREYLPETKTYVLKLIDNYNSRGIL